MGTKGDNTKQRICDAARELFQKSGYKSVTIQDICDASGLSKGGLYRHFSDKQEILLSLVKKPAALYTGLDKGESATSILNTWLDYYKEDMLDTKKTLALAMYEFASLGNEAVFAEGTGEDIIHLRKLIHYGIQTGEFREVDPDSIMDIFLYAYRGVKMWSQVIPMNPYVADHIVDMVKQLLLKEG